MPDSPEHAVKQAEHKIEGKTLLIRKCKQRRAKFAAVRDRTVPGTPKHKRAVRKYRFWSRRMHEAIYLKFHWKKVRQDAIDAIARRTPARVKLLQTAVKDNGAREGGAFHQAAAKFIGALLAWPWCSTSVGYWLHEALGYEREELPDQAPYSGCWLAWAGGKRIRISKRQDGDINIYDWGDGGMTDHVALCQRSSGQRFGANQDDAVNYRPENPEFLVAVVRPRKRG